MPSYHETPRLDSSLSSHSPLISLPEAFADLRDRSSLKFLPYLGVVKYAARGKYVPKLLCFALVKSWCGSRDKRIKRGRVAKRRPGLEFAGRGKRDKRIQTPGYRRTIRLKEKEGRG